MNKNIQAIYPLTPLQEGILYHSIEMPNSDIYFQQYSCVLEGLNDPEKWYRSWQEMSLSHPVMRTLFAWKNQAKPLQIVRERVSLPWTLLDWSNDSISQQDEKWESLNLRDRDANFDLSSAPLMRCTLVRLESNRYKFLFSFHHIVLDGWSQRLLFDHAVASYNGASAPAQFGKYEYSAFIDWLGLQDKEPAKAFWTDHLAGFEVPTSIVNDNACEHNNVDSNKRSTQELAIPADILEKLNTNARSHQLTLNSLILGAWSIILASHNRCDDVLFGTTVAGRPIDLPNAEKIAGLFINTLPFRAQIDAQATLADWLATLQSKQAACRQYEQTPLTDIQRYSEIGAGTPLFESIIVVENLPTSQNDKNQNEFTIQDPHYTEYSHYPLAILVDPSDGLNLIAVHQESKISVTRAQEVLMQLHTVLLQMSQSLSTTVASTSTLSEDYREALLKQWNRTQHSFPEILPVHTAFEQWAKLTPNKTAIIDLSSGQERVFSYAEVNSEANKLAHYMTTQLNDESLKPNCIVPVLLARSAQSLITFLAVMKTGSAYIPLDPDQPLLRNTNIIAGLQEDELLIISQKDLQHKLPSSNGHLLLIDDCHHEIAACSKDNLANSVELQQLAYVIYTSGSTGTPKGVMIDHKALANSTLARSEYYPTSPETFMLMSSLATDSSIAGIYWTLCTGNTLLVPAKRIEQDMLTLGQLIRKYHVTHFLCIPSLYQLILENANIQDLQSLNAVIVAGESCNQSVIEQHQKRLQSAELYNEYGPSECCVWATASRLSDWHTAQEVSIGKPISNTQVYVLDKNLQPVLPNIIGELYIGGHNVARGYLHQEQRTAKAFINNPFCHDKNTLYKTGDLVKQTTKGNLIYIGRADNQVKMRGFRIEPEEIEHTLTAHYLIEEALVHVEQPNISNDEILEALLALGEEQANLVLSDIEGLSGQNKTGAPL